MQRLRPVERRRSRALPWWIKRSLVGILVSVAVLVPVWFMNPWGQVAIKTAFFIPQIVPSIPVKPLRWITAAPRVEQVRIPHGGDEIPGAIYRPQGKGPFGALVLTLGVSPAPLTDPRVVNLAEGLSRAGIAVLIPVSDNLVHNRVKPSEIDALVTAFQYLAAQDYVDPHRVGFAGFCVGAALATVAAQDPRIRDRVEVVNAFGAYNTMDSLIVSVASKSMVYNGWSKPWQPDKLTVQVLTEHLINSVPDDPSRSILQRLFLDKDPSAEQQAPQLSQVGTTVYDLLKGTSPEEASFLIVQLSPEFREEMRYLSPATSISSLKARVFIMHDRRDALIPYVESKRLADSIADPKQKFYTEFSLFDHVTLSDALDLFTSAPEIWKLYRHLYLIFLTVLV